MNETIKELVKQEKLKLKQKIELLGGKPRLTIIQINDDQASNTYVAGKLRDAEEVGIDAKLIKLPIETSQNELLNLINTIQTNNETDGLIVQLPLPKHINEEIIKNAINPAIDVDGFNVLSKFNPCTPAGIIYYLDILKEQGLFTYDSKNAVVIGRSNIVGKPMAKMLLERNMNVTVLHSKTSFIDKYIYTAMADLIVVATGHINTLDSTYKFSSNAIIIDVGINRDKNNKLIGDCERNLPVLVQTPVPGGVGLLTRFALMHNTYLAAKKLISLRKSST